MSQNSSTFHTYMQYHTVLLTNPNRFIRWCTLKDGFKSALRVRKWKVTELVLNKLFYYQVKLAGNKLQIPLNWIIYGNFSNNILRILTLKVLPLNQNTRMLIRLDNHNYVTFDAVSNDLFRNRLRNIFWLSFMVSISYMYYCSFWILIKKKNLKDTSV